MINQLAIALTGCIAIWLVNDPRQSVRKWASVFGLIGQPFWFVSAYTAGQWGIMVLNVVYTASWLRGFWGGWMRSEERDLLTSSKWPQAPDDRRELQANGNHLAPCARFCEANAFEIELRSLRARNEEMRDELTKLRAERLFLLRERK